MYAECGRFVQCRCAVPSGLHAPSMDTTAAVGPARTPSRGAPADLVHGNLGTALALHPGRLTGEQPQHLLTDSARQRRGDVGAMAALDEQGTAPLRAPLVTEISEQ